MAKRKPEKGEKKSRRRRNRVGGTLDYLDDPEYYKEVNADLFDKPTDRKGDTCKHG